MDELTVLSMTRYAADTLVQDGAELFRSPSEDVDPLKACYAALGLDHPKFFKMDDASKLAILAAEPLFRSLDAGQERVRDRIALALFSRSGSGEVDERYWRTLEDEGLASPALFVYTLPNIPAGELTIRHALHGPSMTLLDERPDADRMHAISRMLFALHDAAYVVCGWTDIFAEERSATFLLVGLSGGRPWNNQHLQDLLNERYP